MKLTVLALMATLSLPIANDGCNSITFTANTTSLADGAHALAHVNERGGEKVYVVGNFTAWNPNYPGFELSDNDGDGIWSLKLDVPFQGYECGENGCQDMVGIPRWFDVGDTIEYKFAKTSSLPCDNTSTDNYDPNCWSEGQKFFLTPTEADDAGKVCGFGNSPNADDLAGGGLWETGNFIHVLTKGEQTLEMKIDAWLGTAVQYGYPTCD